MEENTYMYIPQDCSIGRLEFEIDYKMKFSLKATIKEMIVLTSAILSN